MRLSSSNLDRKIYSVNAGKAMAGVVMDASEIIVISNKFATFAFTCKPCPSRGCSDYQCLKVLHFPVKRL